MNTYNLNRSFRERDAGRQPAERLTVLHPDARRDLTGLRQLMWTGGAVRPLRQERHFKDASSSHSGLCAGGQCHLRWRIGTKRWRYSSVMTSPERFRRA